MSFNPSHAKRAERAGVATLALIFCFAACAHAQTATPSPTASPQSSPAPRASSKRATESQLFKNILRDQRAIWTAPFHARREDAKWMLPLGLSTAALVATDRYTAGAIDNDDHLRISHDISRVGSIYSTGGVAATFYLVGRATHNARARETGLLGGEALVDSTLVSLAFKGISQRPRPLVDDASGEFFDGGKSFPSGHATAAWSVATVIAEEYSHRRLVRVAAYGLATAVSLSRFSGRNHFLSDVLVGSALGYGVGRYVYHAHHDPALDGND